MTPMHVWSYEMITCEKCGTARRVRCVMGPEGLRRDQDLGCLQCKANRLAGVEPVRVVVSAQQFDDLDALTEKYVSRQIDQDEYGRLAQAIVPGLEPGKHYFINVTQ